MCKLTIQLILLNRANKFVGIFFSTAGQGGGQETTAMSTMPFFSHMGMIFVPLGGKFQYQSEPK